MNRDLQVVLERIGYDELYERHIPGLGRPSARGERTARSPFPDTSDRNPSFSVNIYSGLWHCFSSDRGGNYVQFRAIMEATEFDEATGLAIPDFDAAERRLLVEHGIVNPIDWTYVERCRDALYHDSATLTGLQRFKPWDGRTLYHLGVGYDADVDRFTMPVYDRHDHLINCRMYRPGGDPKFIWRVSNFGGNFLFPSSGWREQTVMLVEGETDVISLRSFGFAAVCGTVGAGSPVPPGEWWRGKHVYLLGDADVKGAEAINEAARLTVPLAASVRVCKLPEWPERGANADVSDYIVHLLRAGFDFEAVQRSIVSLLNEASLVEHPHVVFDQAAKQVSFGQALSSDNLNQRIGFKARVTARSERRYILPIAYNIICPAHGHNYCRQCPMHHEFHGNAHFELDPREPSTLRLIQVQEGDQIKVMKERHGIIKQCPDPQLIPQRALNVEPVILNEPQRGIADAGEAERQRREAYVLLEPGDSIQENREYDIEGFVYPYPKTQHAVFLLDKFTPSDVGFDRFEMTPELLEGLRIFTPHWQQTVLEKLTEVARDLEQSITLIKERIDLHLAYRTVWHSVVSFMLCGANVDRGWIEALVVGDTRCGKSVAFRRLAEHYGIGLLVDCKMQTPAGILGSVVTSQTTGERYVVPGILPQNDRGIVCFDEFPVSRWSGRQSLIEVLSSTRSEGVARISKAAAAQFPSRVRAIWLANPGMGKLISDLGVSGVEVIPRLISQPEDIARFDFALAVSQGDVDFDLINQPSHPQPALYPRNLSRSLLAWAWSRKPEQVRFTGEAEAAVFEVSKQMYDRYDATIPLVEPADQRTRVAKVAVSVAAQCFSTDATGELLIVGAEHVYAARELFSVWFDKPIMNYSGYSDAIRDERTLRDEDEVRKVFDEQVAPHGRALAEELLRLDEFTDKTFYTIVPIQTFYARGVLQTFYANRCVSLVSHGKREAYELTPPMVKWLKDYINGAARRKRNSG